MNILKRLSLTISLTLVISAAMFSSQAFADPAQLISAPSGTQVNGWYTGHPLATVRAVCNGAPYGNIFQVDVAGWSWSGGGTPPQAQAGRHYVELLSNDISNIYINNDGTLSPYLAGGCSNPDGSSPSTVLWQGYVQWDETPPTVTIASPANNSNEDNSKLTVTGNASDDASGVASVTVNGVSASLSGGSYSAAVSLQTGINTLTVVAKDNAGHQATQSETVFLREIPQAAPSSASPTHPGTQANTPSASTTSAANNNSQSSSKDAKSSDNAAKPTDNLKLVKTVATGTGISLATVLVIIIVMLVLDRLGIIEIKLFHDYHHWRKKHYSKLKANFKKSS